MVPIGIDRRDTCAREIEPGTETATSLSTTFLFFSATAVDGADLAMIHHGCLSIKWQRMKVLKVAACVSFEQERSTRVERTKKNNTLRARVETHTRDACASSLSAAVAAVHLLACPQVAPVRQLGSNRHPPPMSTQEHPLPAETCLLGTQSAPAGTAARDLRTAGLAV